MGCLEPVCEALALLGIPNPDSPVRKPDILERPLAKRLLAQILEDVDQDGPCNTELPWLLTPNKRLHFRPFRLLRPFRPLPRKCVRA